MSKFSIFLIIALSCLSIVYSDQTFPRVQKEPPTKEEFNMHINEQGWKFTEKVTFDMKKKTIVHHVPAHRNLSESKVMIDFVTNLTVTRIPSRGVCFVRPTSQEEKSFDVLKNGMDTVSSREYKAKTVTREIRTHWRMKKSVDLNTLSDEVADFCRGMRVYEVEQYTSDGQKELNAFYRSKRNDADWIFCDPLDDVRNAIRGCPSRSQWKLKCKMSFDNCFYFVTCTKIDHDFRNGQCTDEHLFSDFICCTPFCAT